MNTENSYTYSADNIINNGGQMIVYNNSSIDLHPTAQIVLAKNLFVNYNQLQDGFSTAYLKLHEQACLQVNGDFRMFYNSTIQVFKNGVLTLGNSYINSNTVISCAKKITIGDGVAIARNVAIYDSDHHDLLDAEGNKLNPAKEITIDDHVWIGTGAIILKGVHIGEGAVIGAGSVVTKDVPDHAMVAGNPAVVIRNNVIWK